MIEIVKRVEFWAVLGVYWIFIGSHKNHDFLANGSINRGIETEKAHYQCYKKGKKHDRKKKQELI